MNEEPPAQIGKYQVSRELARGTIGVVYEAYDPVLERPVAVKVALSGASEDPHIDAELRQQFFNEAHAAGVLRHENILEVFDAGVDDGRLYIVMELVKGGKTIREFCEPGTLLPVAEAVEIIFRCALALDYAHAKGVIHRDIKPSNILLTPDGAVKIADFSTAHLNREDMATTMPMGFVGSPRFMAPEQIQEDIVTSQADLFALGVVAYQLLCGRHPFGGETFSTLVYRIVNEPPHCITDLRPELPPELVTIINTALSKDPRERFSSGAEFAQALTRVQPALGSVPGVTRRPTSVAEAARLPAFSLFPESEVATLLQCGFTIDMHPGQVIMHRDADETAVYIVLQGVVDLRTENTSLRRLGPGGVFGRLGLFSDSASDIEVTATALGRVLKLGAPLLDSLPPACHARVVQMMAHPRAAHQVS